MLPGIFGIKRSNNNHHHDNRSVEIIIKRRNPIIRFPCFATSSPDHWLMLLLAAFLSLIVILVVPVAGQRLLLEVPLSAKDPVQAFPCPGHAGDGQVATGSPGEQETRVNTIPTAVSLSSSFPGCRDRFCFCGDRFCPDTLSCSCDGDHDNVTATPNIGTDVMVMATRMTGIRSSSSGQPTRFRRQVMNLAPLTSSYSPDLMRSLDLSQEHGFMRRLRDRSHILQRGHDRLARNNNMHRRGNMYAGTSIPSSRDHQDANYIQSRRMGVPAGGAGTMVHGQHGIGHGFASSAFSSSSSSSAAAASSFRRERASGWRNRFPSFP